MDQNQKDKQGQAPQSSKKQQQKKQKKQDPEKEKQAEAAKNAGEEISADDKKAQRDAANKAKAEKKKQAMLKKQQKLQEEVKQEEATEAQPLEEKQGKKDGSVINEDERQNMNKKFEEFFKYCKEKDVSELDQLKSAPDWIKKMIKDQDYLPRITKFFNKKQSQKAGGDKPLKEVKNEPKAKNEPKVKNEAKDDSKQKNQKQEQKVQQKQAQHVKEQIQPKTQSEPIKIQQNQKVKKLENAIQRIQSESHQNTSQVLQGQFAVKNFDYEKLQDFNPTQIINFIYQSLDSTNDGEQVNPYPDMHPAVRDTGIKLLTNKLYSTNQISVALLLAISEVIREFEPVQKNMIYHQELLQLIRDKIVPFFEQCCRFSSGTEYTMRYVRKQIGHISQDCQSLTDLKTQILEIIDNFINERILYAQDTLISNGLNIISENVEETILVYGNYESQTIESLLKKAHDTQSKRFKVIVVDSAPDYFGRGMVKRLANYGIKCQYTLIQMVNFLIQSVTKCFLPASYILCNGSMVGPIGSGMLACIAHKNHVPVVAVCETYKFEDRVNLDQINNNEQDCQQKAIDNFMRQTSKNAEHLDAILAAKSKKGIKNSNVVINIKYDLSPQKYLSMIVCEIGNIPPHSVPVVIREIINDEEDTDILNDDKSDSVGYDDEEDEMEEQDNEDSESDDEHRFEAALEQRRNLRRDSMKQKRIQQNMERMKQQQNQ